MELNTYNFHMQLKSHNLFTKENEGVSLYVYLLTFHIQW
jgi:hypothetical protein